jgi:hypothetical protein
MGVVRVRIACELCKAWEPFVLCRSALLQAASKKKTGSATSCEHPRANGTHRTVHTRLLCHSRIHAHGRRLFVMPLQLLG